MRMLTLWVFFMFKRILWTITADKGIVLHDGHSMFFWSDWGSRPHAQVMPMSYLPFAPILQQPLKSESFFTECTPEEFECSSGQCIPFNLICDKYRHTVAFCHLNWALKSANPLILEQPLNRTIEDNLFLLFFLSGRTKNKWIRTF